MQFSVKLFALATPSVYNNCIETVKKCHLIFKKCKKSKRKVQRVPHSQAAAHPRHEEEEETDKTKQAQIEQTYEKH